MREKIKALSVSPSKGVPKIQTGRVRFVAGLGIEGDAHAGPGKRQVSLLFEKQLIDMRKRGVKVNPGDMAENILLSGKKPEGLKPGDVIKINSARLQITQTGKKCLNLCSIGKKLGSCSMSGEGVFLRVIAPGVASEGDEAVKDE